MGRILSLALLFLTPSGLLAEGLEWQWQRGVVANDLGLIGEQLEKIPTVDLPTARGKTALMATASQGAVALSRALIAAGADVNARNNTGGTPLMYAVTSGNTETVRLLLDHGARRDQQSANGWTALMMAAAKRHGDIIELLGSRGADGNLPDVYGWTPLMRGAYEGYQEVVRALLQQPGIDLERRNDHGQTALHLAAIRGHVEIVATLLDHGAQSDSKDFAGRTPADIAHLLNHTALTTFFTDRDSASVLPP